MAAFNFFNLWSAKPEDALPPDEEWNAWKKQKASQKEQNAEKSKQQTQQTDGGAGINYSVARDANDEWKDNWHRAQMDASQPTQQQQQTPPTPEPAAEEIKPKLTPKITDDGVRGTPTYKYDVNALEDEAYNQVMDDYHAEQKNVEKQRAYIDKALDYGSRVLDRREQGLKFYEDRFNNAATQQEKDANGSWTDWLNPTGILKAPIRLFMGQEIYDPKSGQYVRQMPKDWNDLSWNLLRNVGMMASGIQYTGGSGGKGGISFGYNPSMPMALFGMQRENAHRPFKDWEEIQRGFADDARDPSFKSWAINNPYPKAQNPWEEPMRKRVLDEMAFSQGQEQYKRYMDYFGYEPGSPEAAALEQEIFGRTKVLGADLLAFDKRLRNSGLFTDEQIQELERAFVYHSMGVTDPAEKRASLALKERELNQKALDSYRNWMLKAYELDANGRHKEAQIAELHAKTQYWLARALGGEGGITPYSLDEQITDRDDLTELGALLSDEEVPADLEVLQGFLDSYSGPGGYLERTRGMKKGLTENGLGISDTEDSMTGVKTPGLNTYAKLIKARIDAMKQAAAEDEEDAKLLGKEQSEGDDVEAKQEPTPEPAANVNAEGNKQEKNEGEAENKAEDIADQEWKKFNAQIKQAKKNLGAKNTPELFKLGKKQIKAARKRISDEEEAIGNEAHAKAMELEAQAGNKLSDSELKKYIVDYYLDKEETQKLPRYRIVSKVYKPLKKRIDGYIANGGTPDRKLIWDLAEEALAGLSEDDKNLISYDMNPIWGWLSGRDKVYSYVYKPNTGKANSLQPDTQVPQSRSVGTDTLSVALLVRMAEKEFANKMAK